MPRLLFSHTHSVTHFVSLSLSPLSAQLLPPTNLFGLAPRERDSIRSVSRSRKASLSLVSL